VAEKWLQTATSCPQADWWKDGLELRLTALKKQSPGCRPSKLSMKASESLGYPSSAWLSLQLRAEPSTSLFTIANFQPTSLKTFVPTFGSWTRSWSKIMLRSTILLQLWCQLVGPTSTLTVHPRTTDRFPGPKILDFAEYNSLYYIIIFSRFIGRRGLIKLKSTI